MVDKHLKLSKIYSIANGGYESFTLTKELGCYCRDICNIRNQNFRKVKIFNTY